MAKKMARCKECGDIILKYFYNPNCKSCIKRLYQKLYREEIERV